MCITPLATCGRNPRHLSPSKHRSAGCEALPHRRRSWRCYRMNRPRCLPTQGQTWVPDHTARSASSFLLSPLPRARAGVLSTGPGLWRRQRGTRRGVAHSGYLWRDRPQSVAGCTRRATGGAEPQISSKTSSSHPLLPPKPRCRGWRAGAFPRPPGCYAGGDGRAGGTLPPRLPSLLEDNKDEARMDRAREARERLGRQRAHRRGIVAEALARAGVPVRGRGHGAIRARWRSTRAGSGARRRRWPRSTPRSRPTSRTPDVGIYWR